jgi:hypothetical protein
LLLLSGGDGCLLSGHGSGCLLRLLLLSYLRCRKLLLLCR